VQWRVYAPSEEDCRSFTVTVFLWLSCSLVGLGSIGLLLAVARFRLAKIDMTFFEFARRLVRGGG
jgi:hypothetical protein